MRELKFRAWDKIRNKMNPVETIHFFEDGYRVWMTSGRGLADCNPANETILMQFTGLKDKNGKEIYEGDIIRYEEEFRGRKTIETYTVKFGEGQFYLESHEDPEYNSPVCISPIEVIANIYENPELLTNKI